MARRTLSTVLGLVLLGCTLGLTLGLVRPWLGLVCGVGAVWVLGAGWALRRADGLGLVAACVASFAAAAFAIEGHHAAVVLRPTVPLLDVSRWDPSNEPVVSTSGVSAQFELSATFESIQRFKRGSRRIVRIATPLVDAFGTVVAVSCAQPLEPVPPHGRILASLVEYEGEVPDGCAEAWAQVAARSSTLRLAPGVESKFARLYLDEGSLQQDQHLLAAAVSTGVLVVALVVLSWLTKPRQNRRRD